VEPLAKLAAALLVAGKAKPEPGDEENAARMPAWAALQAVIEYLREVGLETATRAPLIHLLAALDDANAGRSNSILTPRDYRPGDRKLKTFPTAERPMAAAAVTLLHQEGKMPTAAAVTMVERALGIDGLHEFRKNLMKKRAPEVARDEYWEWLRERKRQKELSVDDFVDVMLKTAAALTERKKG
jgi:hypothetical protein